MFITLAKMHLAGPDLMLKAAQANQYFAGASGFPDFMIYNLDMLKSGAAAVKMAGFFDNYWKLSGKEYIVQ